MKKAAVYMDYNEARIIEWNNGDPAVVSIIKHEEPPVDDSLKTSIWSPDGTQKGNNEFTLNHKEMEYQKKYFKQLEDALKGYDEILLFGSGNAKKVLRNQLLENKAFENTLINLLSTDKLTDNQQLAEARKFFMHNSLT